MHLQDDDRSRADSQIFQEVQKSLIASSSIEEEEEPVAPLKTPKEDSKKYCLGFFLYLSHSYIENIIEQTLQMLT